MPVVDVDCHLDLVITPQTHPLRAHLDRLPSTERFIADALVGDLLHRTPERSRPDVTPLFALLPDANVSSSEQATRPGVRAPVPLMAVADRLAWMDAIGIDVALMNPGGWAFLLEHLGTDRPEGIRRCNDFLADQVEGATARLAPVSLIDWGDLDGTVAELARMRARGSRAFWLRGEPFAGLAPGHPDLDPLWSAATDLGMVAILHIGTAPTRFEGGWANGGWELPGSPGAGGFFRYANAFNHHAAEMFVGSLLYGGVFGRHPTLTVLLEELSVGWLPGFVAKADRYALAGPWPYPESPGAQLRRNLRVTPLIGLGDQNVLGGLVHELPDLFVFSSDFAHGEGNADPIALYEPELSALDPALAARFLGDNIAACYARMGDPL